MAKATLSYDLDVSLDRLTHEHAPHGYRYIRVIQKFLGSLHGAGGAEAAMLLNAAAKEEGAPAIAALASATAAKLRAGAS